MIYLLVLVENDNVPDMVDVFAVVADMVNVFAVVANMVDVFAVVADMVDVFAVVADMVDVFAVVADMVDVFAVVADMVDVFAAVGMTVVDALAFASSPSHSNERKNQLNQRLTITFILNSSLALASSNQVLVSLM